MPNNNLKTGLPETIAQRLETVESFTIRLTQGWTVSFSKDRNDPNYVWVDFFYNGLPGRDENYTMSVRIKLLSIDSLWTNTLVHTSSSSFDRSKFRGCYGIAVYRTLCDFAERDK